MNILFKKKQSISIVLLLIILLTSVPIDVFASEIKNSDFIFEDKEETILKEYTGTSSNILIPDNVRVIKTQAFKNKNIEEVVLNQGLEVIEDEAFITNDLSSIIIPESVTTIGNYSFANNKIISIEILKDAKLSNIGSYAFQDNIIKNVDLKNFKGSVINTGAFKGNQISSISMPDSIREVKEEAFMDNVVEKVDLNADKIHKTSFIGGDGYTVINTNKDIKSGYQDDMYGHIVNPVNIKIKSVDENGDIIIPDQKVEFNRKDYSQLFSLNQPSFYKPQPINGYEPIKKKIEFTPNKEWFELIVDYKKIPGPTIEQVNFLKNKREGSDVNEEELLHLIKATSDKGVDISSKVIVEPKQLENASEGIHEILYAVEDNGVIATERVNIFIGEDPMKIEVGNSGWVLGDFVYFHEGINEDGSSEISKDHIGSITNKTPMRRSNGKKHQYVVSFSKQGLDKFNDGLKTLSLPHLNPYTLQPITGVTKNTKTSTGKFSQRRYVGSLTDHETIEMIDDSSFYDSSFQGQFPKMPNLEHIGESAFHLNVLRYPNEVFSGYLPKLPNLKRIESNAFSGSMFNGNFPQLESLEYIGYESFNRSRFSGSFPEMKNLEVISNYAFGRENSTKVVMTGEFPLLPKLRYIGSDAFAKSKFTGNFPQLKSLETIKEKAFVSSVFEGELPLLEKLELAEEGSLSKSNFTGNFPNLSNLKKLGGVYDSSYYGVYGAFQNSNFTGDFPKLEKLEYVGVKSFSKSKFTGNFPDIQSLRIVLEQAFESAEFDGEFPKLNDLRQMGPKSFPASKFVGAFPVLENIIIIDKDALLNSEFDNTFPVLNNIKLIGESAFANSKFVGDFESQPLLKTIGAKAFIKSQFDGDFKTQPNLEILEYSVFYNSKFKGHFETQPKLKRIGNVFGGTFHDAEFIGNFPDMPVLESMEDKTFYNSKFEGAFPDLPLLVDIGNHCFYNSVFTGELPNLQRARRIMSFSFYNSKFSGAFPPMPKLISIGEGSFYSSEFTGKFPELPALVDSNLSGDFATSYRAVPMFYNSNFDKEITIGNKTSVFHTAFGNKFGNIFNIRTKDKKGKGNIVNDYMSSPFHEQNPVYGGIDIKDKATGRSLIKRDDVIFRHESENSMYYYGPMLVGYDLPLTKYGSGDIFDSVKYKFPIKGSIYDKQDVVHEVDVVDKDTNKDYDIKMEIFGNEKAITKPGQKVNGRFTFTYPDKNPLDESLTPMLNGFLGLSVDKNVFSSLEVDLEKPLHRQYSNKYGYMLTFRPDLKPGESYEVNFSLVVGDGFKSGMVSDNIIMSFYPHSDTGIIKSQRFEYNVNSMPQIFNTKLMNSMSSVSVISKDPYREEGGKKFYTPTAEFTINPKIQVDKYLSDKYNINLDNLNNTTIKYQVSSSYAGKFEIVKGDGWSRDPDNNNVFLYNVKNASDNIPPLTLKTKYKEEQISNYHEIGLNEKKIAISGELIGSYNDLKVNQKTNSTVNAISIPVIGEEEIPEFAGIMSKKLSPMPIMASMNRRSNTLVGFFGVDMYPGFVNEDGTEHISNIHRIRREPSGEFFKEIKIKNSMSTDKKSVEILVPFGVNGDILKSETKEFFDLNKKVSAPDEATVLYLNTDKDINEIYTNGKDKILETANSIFGDSWSSTPDKTTKAVKLIIPNVKSRTELSARIPMIANPADTNKDWFKEVNSMGIYTHKDSNRESRTSVNHLFIEKKDFNQVDLLFKVVDQYGKPVAGSPFDLYSDIDSVKPGEVIDYKMNNTPYLTNSHGEVKITVASNYSYKLKPVNKLRPQYYHPIDEDAFTVLRDEIYPLENEDVFSYSTDILQRRHEEYPVFFKNLEVYNDLKNINQYLLKNEDGKQLKTATFTLIDRDTKKPVEGLEEFKMDDDQYKEITIKYGKYELKQKDKPTDNAMPYDLNPNSYFFELGKYGDLKGSEDGKYKLPGRFVYYPNKINEQKSTIKVSVTDFLTDKAAEGATIRLENMENSSKNVESKVNSEGLVEFKDVPGGVYSLHHIDVNGNIAKQDTISIVVSKLKSETIEVDMLVNVVKLSINMHHTIKRGLNYNDAHNYAKIVSSKSGVKHTVREGYNGLYNVVRIFNNQEVVVNDKVFPLDDNGTTGQIERSFIPEIINQKTLNIKEVDLGLFSSSPKEINLSDILNLQGFDNDIVVDIELIPSASQLTLSPYSIEESTVSKNITAETFDDNYKYELDNNYKNVYVSKDGDKVNSIYYKSTKNMGDQAIDMNLLNDSLARPVEKTVEVNHSKENKYKAKAIHLLDRENTINVAMQNIDGKTKEILNGGVFDIYVNKEIYAKDVQMKNNIIDITNIPANSNISIIQSQAPDNYRLNTSPLNIDGLQNKDLITFENYKLVDVPNTGTSGKLPFIIGSIVLMLIAYVLKKKEY